MVNEIVREQLGKTIKTKETRIRTFRAQEKISLDEAESAANSGNRLQIEVDELRDHLDTLGGPVEEEK